MVHIKAKWYARIKTPAGEYRTPWIDAQTMEEALGKLTKNFGKGTEVYSLAEMSDTKEMIS